MSGYESRNGTSMEPVGAASSPAVQLRLRSVSLQRARAPCMGGDGLPHPALALKEPSEGRGDRAQPVLAHASPRTKQKPCPRPLHLVVESRMRQTKIIAYFVSRRKRSGFPSAAQGAAIEQNTVWERRSSRHDEKGLVFGLCDCARILRVWRAQNVRCDAGDASDSPQRARTIGSGRKAARICPRKSEGGVGPAK